MKRRAFITLLGGAVAAPLARPLRLSAQQPRPTPRIGLLLPTSAEIAAPYIDAFRQGMRERGYVEGQNIAFAYGLTDGSPAQATEAALKLTRLKVDVIVAWTTAMAVPAQRATTTIPIVILGVSDPVATGLIESLARPGGNITGVSNIALDLSGKLVELLLEIAPGVNPIAAFANPNNPSMPLLQRETHSAARALGVTLEDVNVGAPEEIDNAFAHLAAAGIKGLVVFPDSMFLGQRQKIAELAIRARLPTVFGRRESVDAGGLVSYGPSLRDHFRQTAGYVDRILRGAPPAALPVEQPTRIELVVNARTAKAIGLKIPASFLLRADEVIE
jgi:putative ABC transport system substrate-binding protein